MTVLAGLRLHGARPVPGSASARKVEWLLALGHAEKRRVAELEALQVVARAIERAAAAVPAAVQARLGEIAALAVELGLAVARELVGAALERGAVDPTPAVVRCLRECAHGGSGGSGPDGGAMLAIHVHPDDLARVRDGVANVPELRETAAKATFHGDAMLARGAVRAETGAGRLRYDPCEVLERVSEQVRREARA